MKENNFQRQNGTPSGGEMFVGLNILSKIGVVFIIIGVIAFSAVSYESIPGLGRFFMITALGAAMLVLGELFRSKGSAVFGNTLIFGGLAELFVSVLIGRFGFHCLGDIAVILGAVVAFAGIVLAKFHRSGAMLIITVIGAYFVTMTALSPAGYFLSGVLLVMLHSGNALVCRKYSLAAPQLVGITAVMLEGFYLCAADRGAGAYVFLDSLSGIYSGIFVVTAGAVYAGGAILDSLEKNGRMHSTESAILIYSQILSLAMPVLLLFNSKTISGVGELILAAIYAVCVMFLAGRNGKGSKAGGIMLNLFLTAMALAILRLFPAVWAYMVFHVFAVIVLAVGLFSGKGLLRGWGYGALSFAELLFLYNMAAGFNLFKGYAAVYTVSYALNTLLWIAVMALFAVKGKRGSGFQFYSVMTIFNTAWFGVYMIFNIILEMLNVTRYSRNLYADMMCAALFMLLGFASGKLSFLKKGVSAGASMGAYAFGMLFLNGANSIAADIDVPHTAGVAAVIVYILLNIASVISVLDIAMQIKSLAPGFARAVGLVTSFYALMTLTVVLDVNGWAAFTSCIVSVIYLLTAVVWIGIGFAKRNTLLRRFGLALSLFSSAKLFLFDFSGIGAVGRTLMFIGFGVTLLIISFTYGICESYLKNKKP